MEYLETVNELNSELYEMVGEVEEQFYYTTNGFIDVVGFGDIMLWNSQISDRSFNEETNNYEPFTPYIKGKFNEYVDKLQTFRFNMESLQEQDLNKTEQQTLNNPVVSCGVCDGQDILHEQKVCKHNWIYGRSDSYWRFCGRNSREYYHADYYFCEKCLEEKVIEKKHSCYDSETWTIPEWAKTITKKVAGYE